VRGLCVQTRRVRGSPSRFLKEARVGSAANYRSAPLIGYDAAKKNTPIRGDTTLLVNLMLGKIFPTGHGESFNVQINLQNLLGAEAMIPSAASTLRRALCGERFAASALRRALCGEHFAAGSCL
jgi:hypothetical protein